MSSQVAREEVELLVVRPVPQRGGSEPYSLDAPRLQRLLSARAFQLSSRNPNALQQKPQLRFTHDL